MFNRARVVTLCTLTGVLALGGCSTSQHNQQVSLGAVSDNVEPATPRVNRAIALQLADNALKYNDAAIQLGAGDRFGSQVHASYVASIRLSEQYRMYAEVESSGSNY